MSIAIIYLIFKMKFNFYENNKYPPAKLVVFHEPYKGKLLACVLRRINGPAAAFYFTCYP